MSGQIPQGSGHTQSVRKVPHQQPQRRRADRQLAENVTLIGALRRAQTSWLTPAELVFLIHFGTTNPELQTVKVPTRPPSESLAPRR
jgi:hypothetical protein